ncbi:hypothetical protein [Paenibacillus sp. HJGM_3]|uniref:hypothetical protein n=1 Tax=Paenibacillus sp. HJGM_3 TaxID=3379816 RepID=UPI00385A8C67
MFNVTDLAFEEARLVSIAEYEYGEFFDVANSCIRFLWRFHYETNADCWIFLGFLAQIQKSLQLAILSTLRRHDIQTSMMLRYTLETICLSLYSMEFREEKYFSKYLGDGTVLPTKALSDSYNWLNKILPEQSEKIKNIKESINKFSVHGNILPSFYNTDLFKEDGKATIFFFDKEHSDITKMRMWWIADTCIGYMMMISIVNEKFPTIKLVSNFDDVLESLFNRIKKVEAELRKTETFLKYY